ncbi:MAG: hypothetical protein HY801_05345 [Candidatus Lindowbacteria bacterium]|nr:hypothetical protein [Candidatus Lindowbacteria bacterium]
MTMPPMSWFDPNHCEELVNLFPGFLAKWQDVNWHEALREAIYWYLNANYTPRGIDAGIILSQAAIERLSYSYSVENNKLISSKGFKDLWASDKLRLLFSSLGLPLEIPPLLTKLSDLAKKCSWIDAPKYVMSRSTPGISTRESLEKRYLKHGISASGILKWLCFASANTKAHMATV